MRVLKERVCLLESKLEHKNKVISELMEHEFRQSFEVGNGLN